MCLGKWDSFNQIFCDELNIFGFHRLTDAFEGLRHLIRSQNKQFRNFNQLVQHRIGSITNEQLLVLIDYQYKQLLISDYSYQGYGGGQA